MEGIIRFARRVGLAFQLADDVRDFMGDTVLGRPRGTDLREGVYTLPVLMMAHERRPGAAELRQILNALRTARMPHDIERLIGAACCLLESEGALAWATARAEAEVSAAFNELGNAYSPVRARLAEFARGLLFGLRDARAVA
jgi:heptaprenyl diphosphate synthase